METGWGIRMEKKRCEMTGKEYTRNETNWKEGQLYYKTSLLSFDTHTGLTNGVGGNRRTDGEKDQEERRTTRGAEDRRNPPGDGGSGNTLDDEESADG